MADEETKTDEIAEESKEETAEAPASAEATADKPVEEKAEEKKEESFDGSTSSPQATQDASAEAEVKPAKAEKPAPSGKFKDMIKEIESMTVSDLAELVKALEERFGVSASAPMMMAGAVAGAGAGAPEVEEKSNYTVLLKDSGAQKIAVIKAVREINQELGLKEAKDLVDGAPKEIKKDIPKADAEEAKKKLEAAGATVELI